MANFPMDDSRYEEDVRKLETSDKAHAGVFNDVFQKLVNNGAFLKRDKVSGEGGDVSGTVVEAMEAASGEFPVPMEGDTSGRLWGKMKKFCGDFNNMKAGLLTVGKIVNDAKTNNPELPVSAAVAYELGKEVERVSGEVSVLNTNLSVSQGSISVLQSYITNSNYTLVKYGKVVCFSWAFLYTNTNTIAGEVIATIPSVYCPIGQVKLTNFIEHVDTVNTLFITSSGLLQAYINTGSSGWNARINLSWIIN